MHGCRHPRRSSTGPAFVLVSVLALLALACFAAAPAGADGTVYEPETTTVPGETKPPKATNKSKDGSSDPGAKGSKAQAGGGGSEDKGGSSGGSSPQADDGGDSGQGSPGNGSDGAGNGMKAEKMPIKSETLKPVAAVTPEDDSSSPLVPILIVIAALAAVSIVAVVVRQRRHGDGGPTSPDPS